MYLYMSIHIFRNVCCYRHNKLYFKYHDAFGDIIFIININYLIKLNKFFNLIKSTNSEGAIKYVYYIYILILRLNTYQVVISSSFSRQS